MVTSELSNGDQGRALVAQGMLRLLVGNLLVFFDFNSKQTQSVTLATGASPDGTTRSHITGWQFDFIPDEIGYFAIALAFFGMSAAAQGSLRVWLKALAAWQMVMILLEVFSHRVDLIEIKEITEFGYRTVRTPRLIEGTLVVYGAILFEVAIVLLGVAASWCLARLCQSLELVRGARLWTRFTWVSAAFAILYLAGLAYVIAQWSSNPDEALDGVLPALAVRFVVASVLAVAFFIAMGVMFLQACFGTRTEAQATSRGA